MKGESVVYLVGAGPGDPELITLRAKTCIEHADVIIYDYLTNEDILRFAPQKARLIFVGKQGFSDHIDQDQINELIAQEAMRRPGLTIVRLKGGDPFVFGRGGEEAAMLHERGIAFEVVPGITAGIAAPAYAGIPVTHRGLSSSVTFVTGHETPEKDVASIDWAGLARGSDTLCFYMGIRNLDMICSRLMDHGRAPATPVALIRWGTMPGQETLVATLADAALRAREENFKAPAIIVVGEVVTLREHVAWFERKPLFGKRIVVTRASDQARDFSYALRAQGANVIETPMIAIRPFADGSSERILADGTIQHLSHYDWVVFTSVNGVNCFFDMLSASKRDARALGGVFVAAIGPATAQALADRGIDADIVPDRYIAESVAHELIAAGVGAGSAVLIPRACTARDVLPDMLRDQGATVDVIPVYCTILPEAEAPFSRLKRYLENGKIDAITFTSPSTVHNFSFLLEETVDTEKRGRLLADVALASIGPITSKAMRERGLNVSVESPIHTIPGLTEALQTFLTGKDRETS